MRLSIIAFIITLWLMPLLFGFLLFQTNIVLEHDTESDNTFQIVFDLNLLTGEFFKYGEARSKVQMNEKLLDLNENTKSQASWHERVERIESLFKQYEDSLLQSQTTISQRLETEIQLELQTLSSEILDSKISTRGQLQDSLLSALVATPIPSVILLILFLVNVQITKITLNRLGEAKAVDDAILQGIAEGLMVVNEHGVITLVNNTLSKLTGWPKHRLIGESWKKRIKLLPENPQQDSELSYIIQRAQKGESGETSKLLLKKKGGKKIPVHITAAPIVKNGILIGSVSIIDDITEEKNIDKIKTEFVSLAAHQLRTPMTAIRLNTEMIREGNLGRTTKKQLGALSDIDASIQRLIHLVDGLLNVSRLELGTFSVDPEPINVTEFIHIHKKDIDLQAQEKHIVIKEHVERGLPDVSVDPNLLGIILQNLLSNAIKYTPEKGTVSITVEKAAQDLLIKIADTGYGIPKNQQPRIFSKLFRAQNAIDARIEGTGLGLYVIKYILDETGGSIEFESEEGVGTTFFVRLPLSGMKQKKGLRKLT